MGSRPVPYRSDESSYLKPLCFAVSVAVFLCWRLSSSYGVFNSSPICFTGPFSKELRGATWQSNWADEEVGKAIAPIQVYTFFDGAHREHRGQPSEEGCRRCRRISLKRRAPIRKDLGGARSAARQRWPDPLWCI